MKASNLLRSELRALDQMVSHIQRRHLAGKTVAEVLAFYRAIRKAARGDVRRQTTPMDFEPEDGWVVDDVRSTHFQLLCQTLLAEHFHRRCQMLFLPSFAPSGVVYVVRLLGDGDGSVVVKELERPHDRKVQRWEVTIARTDADLLERLWVTMLARVHYEEEPNHGLDGVDYHAAHFADGFGYRSGKAWSPRRGTLASDFIAVAEDLREFAKKKDDEREGVRHSLIAKAEALLERALSTRS